MAQAQRAAQQVEEAEDENFGPQPVQKLEVHHELHGEKALIKLSFLLKHLIF